MEFLQSVVALRPKLPECIGTATGKYQWNGRTGSDAHQDVHGEASNKHRWSDGKNAVVIHTEIDEAIKLPRDDESLEPFKETLPTP